jgi:DNA-binding beta-propeller fold protein YncE
LIASADGKRVYVLSNGAGGSTPSITVIDTASKAVAGTPIVLGADDYSQKPLAISADGSRLAVQGAAGVDIIDTDWRTVTRRVTVSASERATFSPDGRTLYVVSETNKILAVDTATGTVATRINLAEKGFRDIALSPDGTRLYAATTDSVLSTFDAATGVLISAVSLDHLAQDIAVSADGKWVYALTFFVDYTGITSSLHTLDTTTGLLAGTALSVGTLTTNLTISPDGKRVYVPSGADGRTYVINTGRPTQVVAGSVDT